MTETDSIREHTEIIEGAGGPKARIVGHRIRVIDVAIWHERMGMSARDIVAEYPRLSLADVYAALAYYFDHQEELDARLAAGEAFAEEMRRRDPGPLAEKLKQAASAR